MKYKITIDEAFWPARYEDWDQLSDEEKKQRYEQVLTQFKDAANEPNAIAVFGERFAPYVHITPTLPDTTMLTTGVLAIAKERNEQLSKHGFDAAHDDQWDGGELEQAAAALLNEDYLQWPKSWPQQDFLRMSEKGTRDRLAVIAAFLAAEIDRIDRQMAREVKNEATVQA